MWQTIKSLLYILKRNCWKMFRWIFLSIVFLFFIVYYINRFPSMRYFKYLLSAMKSSKNILLFLLVTFTFFKEGNFLYFKIFSRLNNQHKFRWRKLTLGREFCIATVLHLLTMISTLYDFSFNVLNWIKNNKEQRIIF